METFLKELGFRKRWLDDRSGYWWELPFNTKLGRVVIVAEDNIVYLDIRKGKKYFDFMESKLSKGKVKEYIRILQSIS